MANRKSYNFVCVQCGKRTSSPHTQRANARLCGVCAPDVDMLPSNTEEIALKKRGRKPNPRIQSACPRPPAKRGRPVGGASKKDHTPAAGAARKVVPAPVAAPALANAPKSTRAKVEAIAVVAPVVGLDVPRAIPPTVAVPPATNPDAAALDQRIAEAREAMNRLAADLSAKRIELAALREQRSALGPAPRVRRDSDAPRRPTLLDAAAQVLDTAAEPMQAKAIWRAIVERNLWQSPNGGKTPFATLAAAIMRDVGAKGAGSRFLKAGRGIFKGGGQLILEKNLH